MCGFVGAWTFSTQSCPDLAVHIRAMAAAIAHRGPDDEGTWVDEIAGIGLGFRRLAILDLTPLGHQPMASVNGRFVLVFNGEIYNHAELRTQLESMGYSFVGRSDTEVMLAAFEAWGVEAAVQRFVGMFAFALWNRIERHLWLGRDRVGKKPLYYGFQKGTLLFGSELKALRRHPDFEPNIDSTALSLFLAHACVPSPYSIYEGISQLQPGHLLLWKEGSKEPRQISYWDPAECLKRGEKSAFQGTLMNAENELLSRLLDAVQLRREADVPVGAFLSGGVDSSLIAALLQHTHGPSVRAFTVSFHEAEFDEAVRARAIAKHLNLDHVEVKVGVEDVLAHIPDLPQVFDEPFADASQLPTFLLCRKARQEFTVAMTGDGGDESFGGYWRTFAAASKLQGMGHIPYAFRTLASRLVDSFPPDAWDRWVKGIGLSSWAQRHRLTGDRIHKVALVLRSRNVRELHQRLLLHADPLRLLLNPPQHLRDPWEGDWEIGPPIRWMLAQDAKTYLPDDVLTKMDRASMANSLEVRSPLLDHRVMEFAWTLPQDMLIRQREGKVILRSLLKRFLPSELVDGPKHGFEVPLRAWLVGPLRDWAEALLTKEAIELAGFHERPIRALWRQHQSGQNNNAEALWPVLVYLQWRTVWA